MKYYMPRSWKADRERLATKSISLVGLVEEICDRIDTVEHAVLALLPEEGRRRRLASEALRLEEANGALPGGLPLYGLVLGVKDIFSADGFETGAGSKLPTELFCSAEAPSVTALKRAGALVLGKTVTTEFAYFAPGPTRNPNDTERTPGGSSSGSAAAVAAGFCHAALGTQTIGSIGRPAAFCGIAGFKPSYDGVSRAGVVPFSESLDHVGLLGVDVSVLFDAMPELFKTGKQSAAVRLDRKSVKDSDDSSNLPRLVVPYGPYLEQTETSAMISFNKTVSMLEAAGYTIKKFEIFHDIAEINERHRRLAAAEMAIAHASWYANYKELYNPKTAEFIEWGMTVSKAELDTAREGCHKLRMELAAALADAEGDLWISPATLNCAPKGIESTGSPIMNLPWTNSGLPTLIIPAGYSPEGMPFGLQIAGAYGDDGTVLRAGIGLEGLLALSRA